jgi:acyl-CoA thioester hydrolase
MPEAQWPDISGRVEAGLHILPVRVYFEDTDFSGAVYHANYLKFCERGRSEWLRLIGIHHHALFGDGGVAGGAFVVRRMTCEFLKAARIDDLLEVRTSCAEATGARLELDQRIHNGEILIFEAKVTVALAGPDGRPRRLPPSLASLLTKAVSGT